MTSQGSSARLLRDASEVVLVGTILALFARVWLVQIFHVPSSSMAPTLLTGDHVVVNKFVFRDPTRVLPQRAIARGDVVVFRSRLEAGETLVKRCVGLGGDAVAMVDKTVLVNGVRLDEPYAQSEDSRVYPRSRFVPRELRTRDNFGPRRVPQQHVFCLGDNRDLSRDSRSFGSVPLHRIVGSATLVLWSQAPRDADAVSAWRGSWLARTRLAAVLEPLELWLRRVRTERIFEPIR
jgi:signal peptidase I